MSAHRAGPAVAAVGRAWARLGWLLVGLAAAALACREPDGIAEHSDGARLFAERCAGCHGEDARGAGPLAPGLISLPADLTRIAARRGTSFPRAEVRRIVDGRAGRPGHGGPEMPRWGDYWARAGSSEAEVAERVDAVVSFLESIQESAVPTPPVVPTRSTQEHMDDLADALVAALPAVFSDAAFGDAEGRAALGDAVAALGSRTEALESHAVELSPSFAPVAQSLAQDARRVRSAFETGKLRGTRYRMGELLENCVACHSRLPATQTHIDRLVGAIDPTALPVTERLRLLLATRQFEAAQDTYEAALAAPEPVINRRGLLIDYLIVSLRVLDDTQRARGVLEALATEPALRGYWANELGDWVRALEAVDAALSEAAGEGALETARRLLRRGGEAPLSRPDAGSRLVYDIAASGQLFRFVESPNAREDELAEAYYWLGVTEIRLGRPPGRERWDDLLEAAIRLAPGSDLSRAAFRRYEAQWLLKAEELSLYAFPRSELRRLEDLRALANLR